MRISICWQTIFPPARFFHLNFNSKICLPLQIQKKIYPILGARIYLSFTEWDLWKYVAKAGRATKSSSGKRKITERLIFAPKLNPHWAALHPVQRRRGSQAGGSLWPTSAYEWPRWRATTPLKGNIGRPGRCKTKFRYRGRLQTGWFLGAEIVYTTMACPIFESLLR